MGVDDDDYFVFDEDPEIPVARGFGRLRKKDLGAFWLVRRTNKYVVRVLAWSFGITNRQGNRKLQGF